MKKVFKYELIVDDSPQMALPKGAEILDVAEQHGKFCIWALVDPDEVDVETRNFRFAGTGHPIKDKNLKHISTFQIHGGDLIFHVFEI